MPRGLPTAIARGAPRPLPGLRGGRLFARFLKVAEACPACGAELHHHRADDLPPYLVILIVGHLVGWGILMAETRFETPLWLHLAALAGARPRPVPRPAAAREGRCRRPAIRD